MRSRIAIFDGYGIPGRVKSRKKRASSRRYGFRPEELPRGYGFDPETLPRGYGFDPEMLPSGYGFSPRTMPGGMGGPLFMNPRMQGLGRRGYLVPPLYGPVSASSGRRLSRKGYKVKKGRNSKAQVRFKKAAKKCARSSRNKRKGSFQTCMRKALKSRRSRR